MSKMYSQEEMRDTLNYWSSRCELAEEENKNLNKYLAETKIHLCFEEDMKKLKEENKKLKDELEELKNAYHQKGIDEQEAIERAEEAEEQIEELTANTEALFAENQQQESDIEYLVEALEGMRAYCQKIDKNACDVFNQLTNSLRSDEFNGQYMDEAIPEE